MLQPDRATPPPYTSAFAVEAARLAAFISPALAAYLLHPLAAHYGRRLIAADPAKESRLANRDARLRLLRWAAVVSSGGVQVVFVGEFANAHVLYPDPDLRPVGKLEIVVAPDDLKPLIRHLGGHGFQAADEAVAGAVSLAASDGSTTLEVRLGLFGGTAKPAVSADQVARATRTIESDGTKFRVPCLEHTLLLAAFAAAEARFGRLCVREVLDAAMLLRLNAAIDWPTVHEIAGASRLGKPLRTLLALLVDLGLGPSALPADLIRPPRWPARRKFDRLADNYRTLFQSPGQPLRA